MTPHTSYRYSLSPVDPTPGPNSPTITSSGTSVLRLLLPAVRLASHFGTALTAVLARSQRPGPLPAAHAYTRGRLRLQPTTSSGVTGCFSPGLARLRALPRHPVVTVMIPQLRIGTPSPYAPSPALPSIDPTVLHALRSYPLTRASRYQPQHAPEHIVALDTSLAGTQTTPPKTLLSSPNTKKLQKPPISSPFTRIPAAQNGAPEGRGSVSRGESAAAGNSGRGALEGPGAQWVHPILPQAPTGEGMGAPKHWKSLSASDPQRSHRAWQRQQSR
jgi:hypothetical protein